jgi:predicted nucleic acid-binding OB-fold protein
MKAILKFDLPKDIEIFESYAKLNKIIECINSITSLIAEKMDEAKSEGKANEYKIYRELIDEICELKKDHFFPSYCDPRVIADLFGIKN